MFSKLPKFRRQVQPLIRAIAWAHGATRVGIGVGMLASPAVAGSFVGATNRGSATVLRPAFAIRDTVLGVGTVWSLAARKPVRHWFVAGTVIEVVELTAITRNSKELPATRVSTAWSLVTAAGLLGGVLIAVLLEE